MVPSPRRQNPQHQPLTVALRKICKDYPAGAGILRELLQNADDAGASTVKFVLDTTDHPASPTLVEGLAEYQGPALLAYNDAVFSEKDFQSLASLGDSMKVHEKATTGKFGLGFSSVYNWTDSPSILSGSTLLFLDPHHSWSRVFNPAGGPDYDFPPSANDEAMANQLHCFSLINTEWNRPFPGTILRIPLRTMLQARKSDIIDRETTIDEIRLSMESFIKEIGSDGLLFLRAVQHIHLSTDSQQLNSIEVVNGHDLVEPKSRLTKILDTTMSHKQLKDSEVYHEICLRYRTGGKESVRSFGVLNFVMASVPDSNLDEWARSQKMFPWVALAAPLTESDGSIDLGRLYSVLPLPILTRLPAHAHACFSVSADRSRLHGPNDHGVQDKRPEAWNEFLFNDIIPIAWARLLLHICQSRQEQNYFHLWPAVTSSPDQWWHSLLRELMNTVSQNQDPVWFTEFGYVHIKDGLLASMDISPRQKEAFREIELRVIYLPDHLLNEAQETAGSQNLSPRTLSQSLVANGGSDRLSNESKLTILEYLANEVSLQDLAGLEIFPHCDETFRSLASPPVFLHRDNLEKKLFARQPERSLDTDQLSCLTAAWIHSQAQSDVGPLRYRSSGDLCEYFLQVMGGGSSDIVDCGTEEIEMINMAWDWILQHYPGNLPLAELGPMWLVPIKDSGVRKLIPSDSSNSATWLRPSSERDVALSVVDIDAVRSPKLIADHGLTQTARKVLLSLAKTNDSLRLRDGHRLQDFLCFLSDARIQVRDANKDTKKAVLHLILDLYQRQRHLNLDLDKNALKSLCIFREVSWAVDANRPEAVTRRWVSLLKNVTFIGIRTIIPLPITSGYVFIDVSEERTCSLLKDLGLVQCLDNLQILEQLVIPALQDGKYSPMNSSIRLHVAELVFKNYMRFCPAVQARVPNLSMVPLQRDKTDGASIFGCSSDIIDPQEPELASLYFDDERRSPEASFHSRFYGVLASCGMIKRLDSRLILERVATYAQRADSFDDVALRAKKLLQMPLVKDISRSEDEFIKSHRWLPAHTPEGACLLTDAQDCRDRYDKPLVGRSWCTLPFPVEPSWKSILGWQNTIPAEILMSQLEKSIYASDLHSVGQTLDYLWRQYLCRQSPVVELLDRLSKLSFIWSSQGVFVRPGQVCRKGAETLMPYLYNVDSQFWKRHVRLLLQACVPCLPDIAQLCIVQETLAAKGALNEADLDVAVGIVQIWQSRFMDSLKDLKVPNEQGCLTSVEGLVFNDAPWESDMTCAVAHPKLSRDSAAQLGMQPISDLLRNGELGLSDFDEDEFDQREDVTDGIRDTLDRYTKESTFHEYLANADDCGSASVVNFLLDQTRYKGEHLLTPELCSLQGPALLIHNDGVFQESDFQGLKHVGRGSKRDDPTTIGKFGRGSQTMYHWTDVPMILSGEYLVILDPQRKHLPLNYRTREKKPGVKIKYARLRATCPDQLVPFNGLWGFDSNCDHYNGTIFRFPLRSEGSCSELKESLHCPDLTKTAQIFRDRLDDARLILLFLRNIESVDFGVRQKANSVWKVSRGRWPESGTFSDWAVVNVELSEGEDAKSTAEKWWRAMEDVDDVPVDLQHRHRRRMKHVECGVAALVRMEEQPTNSSLGTLKARFSNCVPLKFESTLPVQIHASFLLSGDRQNIATDETSQDAGSDWNKWLLDNKIPQMYLKFLEDLGRQIGQGIYEYFPVGRSKDSQNLSDRVRTAFWESLSTCHHRLFPIVTEPKVVTEKGRNAPRSKIRQAPRLIEPGRALFDFLDKTSSQVLLPLLLNCAHYLVDDRSVALLQPSNASAENLVRPPSELRKYIEAVSSFNFVTPSLVRRLLKYEKAAWYVQNVLRKDCKMLSVLLSFVQPLTDKELLECDGCPLLPLMDGKVATLWLKAEDAGTTESAYFFAGAERRRMFSFAASYFVEDDGNEAFVERILRGGKFNICTLQKRHVDLLLECKENWTVNSLQKSWLLNFWEYMNSRLREAKHDDEPDLESLQRFPLLWCRQGGTDTLESLGSFQNSTIVLYPNVEAHFDVFRDFTDLSVVDRKTIPRSILLAETSLNQPESMGRFLRCVERLAKSNSQRVTAFVKSKLTDESARTLRNVLLNFSEASLASLPDVAKDLPIWLPASARGSRLATNEAFAAEDSEFVLPFMKDYLRFTLDTAALGMPKIDGVSLLRDYVLPHLPKQIAEIGGTSYVRFVRGLSDNPSLRTTDGRTGKQTFRLPFSMFRVAANGNGRLCFASGLYDHSEAVFTAAFRSEASSKFLMPLIQRFLPLWRAIGLRHRQHGQLRGQDYLASLQALQQRLTPSVSDALEADIDTVLSPLCTDDSSLDLVDGSTWSAIRKLQVFPAISAKQNDPEYRREQIQNLALRKPFLSMDDIVRHEFEGVCWSQTLFAHPEPSGSWIEASGLNKQPDCATVWQHLTFLAECGPSIEEGEMTSFVRDVVKTYEFLSLNQQESKLTFSQPKVCLWLNVEVTDTQSITLEDVRSRWTSLENLILYSPYCKPPLSIVHPFLGRFSSLLREIGCISIYRPPVSASAHRQPEPAFVAIRQLQQEGILNDIGFEAEGEMFFAHKVVLASRSRYCKSQFSGPWASGPYESRGIPVVPLEDMTFAALKILCNHCYDEDVAWASGMRVDNDDDPSIIAEKLDALLDVLAAADRWLMPDLHLDTQQHIMDGNAFFIRPDNVRDVAKVADEANAQGLKAYCKDYMEGNEKALRLANGEW